jgi:hypothetical protein
VAKILLLDDELTMVQMVADMLRHEGHEVFPFTNIQAASRRPGKSFPGTSYYGPLPGQSQPARDGDFKEGA